MSGEFVSNSREFFDSKKFTKFKTHKIHSELLKIHNTVSLAYLHQK